METIKDFIEYVTNNVTELDDELFGVKLNDDWTVYPIYDDDKDIIAMSIERGDGWDEPVLWCVINYPTPDTPELIYSFGEDDEFGFSVWTPKKKTNHSVCSSNHRMFGAIPFTNTIESLLSDCPKTRPEPIRELVAVLTGNYYD